MQEKKNNSPCKGKRKGFDVEDEENKIEVRI